MAGARHDDLRAKHMVDHFVREWADCGPNGHKALILALMGLSMGRLQHLQALALTAQCTRMPEHSPALVLAGLSVHRP